MQQKKRGFEGRTPLAAGCTHLFCPDLSAPTLMEPKPKKARLSIFFSFLVSYYVFSLHFSMPRAAICGAYQIPYAGFFRLQLQSNFFALVYGLVRIPARNLYPLKLKSMGGVHAFYNKPYSFAFFNYNCIRLPPVLDGFKLDFPY